jgi:hypothetical protein
MTLALLACLVLAAGCGKYGAPVRPDAPTYDEGTVYDAGQPVEPDRRR